MSRFSNILTIVQTCTNSNRMSSSSMKISEHCLNTQRPTSNRTCSYQLASLPKYMFPTISTCQQQLLHFTNWNHIRYQITYNTSFGRSCMTLNLRPMKQIQMLGLCILTTIQIFTRLHSSCNISNRPILTNHSSPFAKWFNKSRLMRNAELQEDHKIYIKKISMIFSYVLWSTWHAEECLCIHASLEVSTPSMIGVI